MQPESTQKTSQDPQEENENDWSKEIEIAEGIKKQALDHYKRESVDTWNIQHSILRNYLWLALTFIAGYCAIFNKAFDLALLDNYCSMFFLVIAFTLALAVLIMGITSMTGASKIEPDDNYVEIAKYLTETGYHQGNHYSMVMKEIKSIMTAIEEAQDRIHNRAIVMRRMNSLLKASIAFEVVAVLLFFLMQIF